MTHKEFIAEYGVILKELAQLPTKADERIAFLKERGVYNRITDDLTLLSFLFSGIKDSFDIEKITANTNSRGWEYDGIAFMEAFEETVRQYKGEEEGRETSRFVKIFDKQYELKYKTERGAERFSDLGGLGFKNMQFKELSRKQQNAYFKTMHLARTLLEDLRRGKNSLTLEDEKELIYNIFGEHKIRKHDYEMLYDMTCNLSFISLDTPVGEDDSDSTMEEILDTGNELVSELLLDKTLWSRFLDAWRVVVANSVNKSNLDIYKAFASRDILEELKLKPAEKPGAKRKPFKKEPAGNTDIYIQLISDEPALLEILHWDYVSSAFDNRPDNFKQVYKWLLRKNGFEFSDKEISEVVGIEDSARSKIKKKYRNQFIEKLVKEVIYSE